MMKRAGSRELSTVWSGFAGSKGLDGGSSQEGGCGELRGTGPAGDVEGSIGVSIDVVRVDMVIAQSLMDALTGGFLLGLGRALPIKQKSLAADGTVNIGGVIRWFAKDLHSSSFCFVVLGCRPVFGPKVIIYAGEVSQDGTSRYWLQPEWYVVR